MPRFFLPQAPAPEEICVISGEDASHISRSLRMKTGERITVSGGGYESVCEIVGMTSSEVRLRSLSIKPCESEPPYRARLFQCLPKGEKFDSIVQKSVETGVGEIIPVISSRVISRPDARSLEGKLSRWNRIAENAAMQCGRGTVPQVRSPIPFESAVCEMKKTPAFFCWEEGGTPLPEYFGNAKAPEDIAFLVGAEGGISEEEAETLEKNGVSPIWLGRRILRCETCAPFVLACISYEFEMRRLAL